ncbi:hypothetical protein BOX15_Mlig027616g1 [Macrostomum lignano]|uniref:Major facilitator superfamily (MFS) profile domain-containing protein n=1 Tax=Macrostomum lignano TaxID=282301 RepID=A0A267FAD4_9PLAT|nr:hypothetical protein BOX15_Mlig027616g1 [Macrostomum lignano]
MVEEGDAIAQAEQEQPQVCSNLLPSKEEVQLSPPNPPDKGYAWLIVLGSFLCNALVDGFCFSFGVMRDHIATSFVGASDSQLSFAGSSLTGAYLLMGPISSALANTFGSRPVVMAGSVLACLSFFIASYLTNFYAFVAIFGVLGGISFGLVYLPAVVTVGFWFESRRAFATGIAVCGSGIGTAIFSVLIDRTIEHFSWRGTLMILSALVLNCALAGSFMMPLERYYEILSLREKRRIAKGKPRVKGNIMKKLIENKKRERNVSQGSLNGWIITTANRVEPPPPDFDDQPVMSSDALHRIAETVLRRKTNASRRLANRSSAALNDSNAAAAAAAANSAAAATAATNNSAATAAATPGNAAAMKSSVPQLVRDYSQSQTSLNNSPSMEQPQRQQQLSVSSEPQSPEHSRFVSGVDLHRCSTGPDDVAGQHQLAVTEEVREAITKSVLREMLRPMNRKDVFHSGSLHQLNEYTRSKMSVAGTREYYRSVTSIPPDAGRPAAPAKSAIKQMLDVSILKSPTFCLLLVSSVLTMLGFLQFYQFIKGYAMKRGIPHNDATLLVTLIGVANTVGRIVAGWASDRSWADALWINNLALIGAGLATAFIPFCHTLEPMIGCACCYGLFIAAWVSLRTILVVELMGLDRLTNAYGLLLLFQGVGIVVGPPLGSAIDQLDPTPNYSLSFYLAGCFLILSGLLGVPLRRLSQWEERREELRRSRGRNRQRTATSGSGGGSGVASAIGSRQLPMLAIGGDTFEFSAPQTPQMAPATAAQSVVELPTYQDQFPAAAAAAAGASSTAAAAAASDEQETGEAEFESRI